MAHGLESRVPLLDHELVELSQLFRQISNSKTDHETYSETGGSALSARPILERHDKMGFPVPMTEWLNGEAYDFVYSLLTSTSAKGRDLVNNNKVVSRVRREKKFSRRFGFHLPGNMAADFP